MRYERLVTHVERLVIWAVTVAVCIAFVFALAIQSPAFSVLGIGSDASPTCAPSEAEMSHRWNTWAPREELPFGLYDPVLFVDAETWDQSAQAVPEEIRTAAKAAHAEFARELDVDDATLAAFDPLVVPSRAVGELVRGGLSQRQAEVQVLRDAGYTQREVGERLGMATNTVKVHCHRIDTKVENAKRLIELVEGE